MESQLRKINRFVQNFRNLYAQRGQIIGFNEQKAKRCFCVQLFVILSNEGKQWIDNRIGNSSYTDQSSFFWNLLTNENVSIRYATVTLNHVIIQDDDIIELFSDYFLLLKPPYSDQQIVVIDENGFEYNPMDNDHPLYHYEPN